MRHEKMHHELSSMHLKALKIELSLTLVRCCYWKVS